MKAYEIMKALAATNSLIDKQHILEENSGNTTWKQLLYLCYNPFQQYYIKKIPQVQPVSSSDEEMNSKKFCILLANLANREITGNTAIHSVAEFLSGCTSEEQIVYSRVLTKDMKTGVAVNTINRVYNKLIPTYDVMLADKLPDNMFSAKSMKLLPEEIVCQYKIDGYRLNIHRPSEDDVIMRTRSGKEVHGYVELEKAARQLPIGYVYDGELVDPELFKHIGSYMDNRDLFSSVMSHAFSKESYKDGIFNVFDMVPLSDWIHCKSNTPYIERLKLMEQSIPDNPVIKIVPTSRILHKSDTDIITDMFHEFIQMGWEGLMIKDANAPYQWKRTRSLLKMKLMDTMDVKVTGIQEGTGKYQHQVGSLEVDYKGNKLNVGSGLSDYQRKLFYDNPESIIGKTIEVAYQAITHNKAGGESVSFPVFKGIRGDK